MTDIPVPPDAATITAWEGAPFGGLVRRFTGTSTPAFDQLNGAWLHVRTAGSQWFDAGTVTTERSVEVVYDTGLAGTLASLTTQAIKNGEVTFELSHYHARKLADKLIAQADAVALLEGRA